MGLVFTSLRLLNLLPYNRMKQVLIGDINLHLWYIQISEQKKNINSFGILLYLHTALLALYFRHELCEILRYGFVSSVCFLNTLRKIVFKVNFLCFPFSYWLLYWMIQIGLKKILLLILNLVKLNHGINAACIF